jgi:DNA-binding transcriptional ArsR family regulator
MVGQRDRDKTHPNERGDMRAKPEFRDRDDTEVAVLDALADRREEGMTVFELRSRVDVDIDQLETALAALKEDDLIEATDEGQRTVIVPEDGVVGPVDPDDEGSLVDDIRDRLPF